MDERRRFGNRGEALAADYLISKGLRILERQYARPYGEIDLICLDGNEVVFVEVKSRRTNQYGYPEDSVTPKKIRHLLRVIEEYLVSSRFFETPWRIDVVAIEFHYQPPRVTHIKAIDVPDNG
ncbi:TPA: YraN family protein [Candidatus Uhrbacteria bacterium]|nr:YraN family protein [Candidatus Uhrbacteria bacterium]